MTNIVEGDFIKAIVNQNVILNKNQEDEWEEFPKDH